MLAYQLFGIGMQDWASRHGGGPVDQVRANRVMVGTGVVLAGGPALIGGVALLRGLRWGAGVFFALAILACVLGLSLIGSGLPNSQPEPTPFCETNPRDATCP